MMVRRPPELVVRGLPRVVLARMVLLLGLEAAPGLRSSRLMRVFRPGPGEGGALNREGSKFEHDYERPAKTVDPLNKHEGLVWRAYLIRTCTKQSRG